MERDVGGATTPLMRRRLRWLALLAGFAIFVIVVAFIGAFRNQGTHAGLPTAVRIDAR